MKRWKHIFSASTDDIQREANNGRMGNNTRARITSLAINFFSSRRSWIILRAILYLIEIPSEEEYVK